MKVSGRWVGFVVAALVALPLAGCGSGKDAASADDPSSPPASSPSYDPQQQRIDDATANLSDFFAVYAPFGEGNYFSREEAECIAGRVVAKPGIKRLQKAGVLNDELQYYIDAEPKFTGPDARAITVAIFACSDAEQLLRKESVDDIDGATPAQRACAADKLTDDLLTYLFTLALQKKSLEPGVAKVAEAFAPCRDV